MLVSVPVLARVLNERGVFWGVKEFCPFLYLGLALDRGMVQRSNFAHL